MDWKNSTTPPPHLTTVVGWFPEYDAEDERHYQLIYRSAIYDEWRSLPDCKESLKPSMWAAIIAPVVDDDLQRAS